LLEVDDEVVAVELLDVLEMTVEDDVVTVVTAAVPLTPLATAAY